jgi:hypothetical protein
MQNDLTIQAGSVDVTVVRENALMRRKLITQYNIQ